MKRIIIFTLIFITAFDAESTAQKTKAPEFEYPEYLTTDDSTKKVFVKQFKQGRVLYGITCSQCHNKKNVIPDFSLPQLMDYEMRLYPVHMEKLSDTKMSDEEMQKIILFLRFKTKSVKIK